MAQRLMKDLPQARCHSPTHKDWNQDLQVHLNELQRQFEERQRSQEQMDRNQINRKEYGGPAL